MNAPAVIPAGFATRLSWPLVGDALLLTQAIEATEDLSHIPVPLDARIMGALGWQTERKPVRRGRPPVWWAKSPASSTWIALPRPSLDLTATRRLVPEGWSWGCGQRGAHAFGWVSKVPHQGPGVPWFECNGLTPEMALTKAALFARRFLAMREEGHLA